MDKIILGKDYALDNVPGTERPNDNVLVVGGTGSGKSLSVYQPTLLEMHESSAITVFAKQEDARKFMLHFQKQGYHVWLLDLISPENSTVSFDPLQYVSSYSDVDCLVDGIVNADPQYRKSTADPYWNKGACDELAGILLATMMTKEKPSMADALDMFDTLCISDYGNMISTTLDPMFQTIAEQAPHCHAVRRFRSFQQLPAKTASCIHSTLSTAINDMFTVELQKMMKEKSPINFKKLASEKTILFIISSAVNPVSDRFANLVFSQAIKSLFEFAQTSPDGKLPRPVRLMYDDFACTAPLNHFDRYISIFRSAGISALILLQSESQLEQMFGTYGSTTIINNCGCYAYLAGGMDLKTCESIAARLNRPLSEVLYMPTGKVVVMCSGKKPKIVTRYDTLHDERYLTLNTQYQEFLKCNREERS